MITKTNFNLIIRNWKRNKVYATISILSLTIGLACINLFIAFLVNEWQISVGSTDNDRIFLIKSDNPLDVNSDEKTSFTMAKLHPILKERYPEIESLCRFQNISETVLIKANKFESTKLLFVGADISIAEFFPIPLIAGDLSKTLSSPNEAAISTETALKVFGKSDVLGDQFLVTTSKGESNYTITSIIDNSITTSFINYDILLPINTETYFGGVTFVKLNNESSKASLLSKLKSDNELLPRLSDECQYYLQAVSDVYFDPSEIQSSWKFLNHREKTFVTIGILAAISILLISCFNYINMYLAQLLKSEKNIGIQSLLGADKKQLRIHLLFETCITTLLGFSLSIGILLLFIPTFNSIFDAHITASFLFDKWVLLSYFILLVLLTIIPSIYLFIKLKQQPLTLLNKRFLPHRKIQFTNGMVVIQCIISILLIIGTIVYTKQLSFISTTANINDNIIEINANELSTQKLKAFKNEVTTLQGIIAGTISASNYLNAYIRTEENNRIQHYYTFDEGFIATHNLHLLKGEGFSSESSSIRNKVIVNETFVKEMGIVNPIGKPLSAKEPNRIIMGVVADFFTEPFSNKVKPIIIYPDGYNPFTFAQVLQLRLEPSNMSETINQIENQWQAYFPNVSFDYTFIKDQYDLLHIKHAKTATMIRFFSFISIFLTVFGLFGLTSYSTKSKTKEIGIRKVNGAKISEVLIMLNKDFIKWVVIAFVIATPVAWYAMHKWLQNFAYKTELSWWIFALAGLLALGIAILTVSFQSWKAATRNPIESLRYE